MQKVCLKIAYNSCTVLCLLVADIVADSAGGIIAILNQRTRALAVCQSSSYYTSQWIFSSDLEMSPLPISTLVHIIHMSDTRTDDFRH